MQELQRHTSILKKVLAKVVQFLRIFLFYVLKCHTKKTSLHVKANHKIRGVNIFQYICLYKAYVDDATFLKNKNSIRQLMESFSQYSCLKPNYEKCEIAEIRQSVVGNVLIHEKIP